MGQVDRHPEIAPLIVGTKGPRQNPKGSELSTRRATTLRSREEFGDPSMKQAGMIGSRIARGGQLE